MSKISAKQIRAARVLTRLSQDQLAREANVPLKTLMSIEAGRLAPSPVYGAAIKVALERHGIEFRPSDKVHRRPPHIKGDPYSYY